MRVCEEKIDKVAYVVRDVDSNGNSIPDAYLILCEKCKEKRDSFDDENLVVKLSSKYKEEMTNGYSRRLGEKMDYRTQNRLSNEHSEFDDVIHSLSIIELTGKLASIEWMKLADNASKKRKE